MFFTNDITNMQQKHVDNPHSKPFSGHIYHKIPYRTTCIQFHHAQTSYGNMDLHVDKPPIKVAGNTLNLACI